MQYSAGFGTGMPSIQTDGCVIEEQPDHLVLAIRVPRKLISDNLPLLAALADCAAPGSGRVIAEAVAGPYVATDPPRRLSTYRHFTPYKLLQIFAIAAIGTIHLPSFDGDVAHASHDPAPPLSSALISGHEPLDPKNVFPHIKGLELCTPDHLSDI
jgi:hypothetical protein